MNSRTWIVLLAFLGWSIISWYWYTCKVKGFCGNSAAVVQQVEPERAPSGGGVSSADVRADSNPEVDYGPLSYRKGAPETRTSSDWRGFLDGILSTGNDGQVLVVSCPYYDDESAPTGYENMGLARAAHVKNLISDKLDPERIEISAHSLGADSGDNETFSESRFHWVTRNENVQETIDGALIYFPSSSDEKLSNPDIEAYLDRLAQNLIANGGEVEIIGHTDNTGSWQFNKSLGLGRARSIMKILVTKGVDPAKVATYSHGEAKPIATNDTEEGKQKNRRTEIIVKK